MSTNGVVDSQPSEVQEEIVPASKGNLCGCLSLDNNQEARGVNFNGIGRGAINMSNVYLASSFILLACDAGGGVDDTGKCADRDVSIYGMKPAALISNISIASSILSALMMPPIGAIVDFTPHRRAVGIVMAVLLAVISGMQIATMKETWFAMAIFQAIVFMIYQLELTCVLGYYPEIARDVGQSNMNSYSTTWSANQFTAQGIVNLIIILASIYGKLNTVQTAMVSQGITLICCVVFYTMSWRLLPKRSRKHELPKGNSLAIAGFRQNWFMAKKIWNNYKSGLRWFLISTVFAEAAAMAVSSTSVIFLSLNLGLTGTQIGIFYEVSLIGVVIGTKLGAYVTKLTTPLVSLQLSELGFGLSTVIGAWACQYAVIIELTYMWGFSIGIFLGWFYPCENLVFSMMVPRNVETELSGFFNYCSQIMGFLPPLAFTLMVQNSIKLPWALTVVALHFIPSIILLNCCGLWEDVLKEAKTVEVDFNFAAELQRGDAGNTNGVEEKEIDF